MANVVQYLRAAEGKMHMPWAAQINGGAEIIQDPEGAWVQAWVWVTVEEAEEIKLKGQ